MIIGADRVLEFVAISIPFVLLGGMTYLRDGGCINILLTVALGLIFLLTSLTSPIPLRWVFVLTPILTGFFVGILMHSHKLFMKFQIVMSLLVSLVGILGTLFALYMKTLNPEGYQRVLWNRIFYSVINISEFFIIFLLVLGITRLLKRTSVRWALVIALCSIALDTDIPFLNYTIIPIICSVLIGHFANKAELAPQNIMKVLRERLSRFHRNTFSKTKFWRYSNRNLKKSLPWMFSEKPRLPSTQTMKMGSRFKLRLAEIGVLMGQFIIIGIFIYNLNYVWALMTIAEEQAILLHGVPGVFVRPGRDWSFAYALLVCASLPLGVMFSRLFASKSNEEQISI